MNEATTTVQAALNASEDVSNHREPSKSEVRRSKKEDFQRAQMQRYFQKKGQRIYRQLKEKSITQLAKLARRNPGSAGLIEEELEKRQKVGKMFRQMIEAKQENAEKANESAVLVA